MPVNNKLQSDAEKAASIVIDAGGQVVGKTKLQKMAYLLELSGLGSGFVFEYRHYGPYSEELASAVADASLQDLISQEDRQASWGGTYSIFKVTSSDHPASSNQARTQILDIAVAADPVALELAATAAYLSEEGEADAWAETQRRKPDKAEKYLKAAKELYERLRLIATPRPLPKIVN